MWRSVWFPAPPCPSFRSEVLSRNSWVTAMPIEAKARDVRNHARNVRSKDLESECTQVWVKWVVNTNRKMIPSNTSLILEFNTLEPPQL